jgi:hypothetical protein
MFVTRGLYQHGSFSSIYVGSGSHSLRKYFNFFLRHLWSGACTESTYPQNLTYLSYILKHLWSDACTGRHTSTKPCLVSSPTFLYVSGTSDWAHALQPHIHKTLLVSPLIFLYASGTCDRALALAGTPAGKGKGQKNGEGAVREGVCRSDQIPRGMGAKLCLGDVKWSVGCLHRAGGCFASTLTHLDGSVKCFIALTS